MSSDRLETLAYPSFLNIDPSIPRHGDFSVLSPSARTSFTRVDTTVYDEGVAVDDEHEPHDDYTEDDDDVEAEAQPAVPQTPQVGLTFLLVTGRRRNMTFEPETTVGRVKELTWNAWPNEWQDERPPAPSYLRILYLGKILQDEDTLETNTASPSPTIVHLSIRSQPPAGAKDTPKKMSLRRRSTMDGEPRLAGCCSACVVS
ncbi:ubiquitin-related domain-containing protein [Irpex rosettiformis]|uniref:Ubiquitin-related domain-containing protein n=1 Tax=Irpex rosettiformis TaxID=378272 RepID=A0ACB8U2N5_9APHY|nr:ubiquitin-related domain-containing protein [Irpex rosettiformis]